MTITSRQQILGRLFRNPTRKQLLAGGRGELTDGLTRVAAALAAA